MEKKDQRPSLFEMLGPKKSFGAGIVTALFIFFVVGFFALLLGGGNFDFGKKSDKVVFGTNTGTAGQGANNAAAGAEAGTGQINLAQITSDDHVMGDLNAADVVVVEYSDFECPFCGRFHPTMEQVVADYEGKVAWVYRHFPLTSIHPNAQPYAEASECVAELGGNEAFWEFGSALFDQVPTVSQLAGVAAEVGVDANAFQECYDSGKYESKVTSQYQDGINAGARGTPYSVVVSKDGSTTPLSGALPIEQVKSVIDAAL